MKVVELIFFYLKAPFPSDNESMTEALLHCGVNKMGMVTELCDV